MYYRRKIILALIDIFGGKLEKIRLQKLLFLFTKRQLKPEYDFIPYKFGCYSYSATADLKTMVIKGLLSDDDTGFQKIDKTDYYKALKEPDRNLLFEIKKEYEALDGVSLMQYTYVNFPYYAINSIKAKEILSGADFEKVENVRPRNTEAILFTIGYEGISLEEYINRLIINNVQVLVDVRRNPLSMKYGFSKSLLKKFCENIGIQYIHFPEVGIGSSQRQELNNQKAYDDLFKIYQADNLSNTTGTQNLILNLLKSKKRIALTCFEANICQCHRKPLAEAILKNSDFKFELKHI